MSLQDEDTYRPLIRHKYQVKSSLDSDEDNNNSDEDDSNENNNFDLENFVDSSSHRFVTRKPEVEDDSVYGKLKDKFF